MVLRNPASSSTNPTDPSGPSTTPETDRQSVRMADHLHRLEMTDPDERHSRIAEREALVPPQPDFLAQLAASIPQVEVSDSIYAPRRFPVPVIGIPTIGQAGPARSVPSAAEPAEPVAPTGPAGPTLLPSADIIPQVQLPAGWDAPLANPMLLVVPPAPLPMCRGRPLREPLRHVAPLSHAQVQATLVIQQEQLARQTAALYKEQRHLAEQQRLQ